jgi:formylglycine-generating enzyme required for sulfatase activity
VPHGEFLMGSKSGNKLAVDDEKPEHTLNIPYDYLMARFTVTNEQFSTFATAAKFKDSWGVDDWQDKLKHPVVNITWHHAIEYCNWLNKTNGKGTPGGLVFRLPTEAEWEKAARDSDGREYPWGKEFDPASCNSKEGGR